MPRWMFASLVILGILILLVALVSATLYPQWYAQPSGTLLLLAAAAAGVVAFASGLTSYLKNVRELRGKEAQTENPLPGSAQVLPLQITQSGGGNIGAGSLQAHMVAGTYIAQAGQVIVEAAPEARFLHQLPAPPADFTGREAEIERLLALTSGEGNAMLGLFGMGGVGKTALALRLAQRLRDEYPDAQLFIDLQGTSARPLSPAEAMELVIHAFHPELPLPENEPALRNQYCATLDGHKALLVLDNAHSALQVEPMLPPGGCFVLITSRRRFTLPGMNAVDLESLPEADAVRLLLHIAPRLAERAGELARRCACLPLALRLSASLLAERPSLPLQEYLTRFEQEGGALAHSGVEASLQLSYNLLEPELQERLPALGVFPAPFDRAAAAAVWEIGEGEAQEMLDMLVCYSFVLWQESTRRFGLHDLVRDFAWRRLPEKGRQAIAERHAAHYLKLLSQAEKRYLQGGEALQQALVLFDQEWMQIRGGQAWAARHARVLSPALRMCAEYPDAGAHCLSLRLHPGEYIRWLEPAVEACREQGDKSGEGKKLGSLGNCYAHLGMPWKAIEYYERALEIARQSGDRSREGKTLGNLGNRYADLGLEEKAIACYEQALAIDRETGNRRGEGIRLGSLGNRYGDLGQPWKSIEYYEQALVIDRETGNRRGEGVRLGNLGNRYADLGMPWKAIECHELALSIAREIGDRQGEANRLGNLGNAYIDLGQPLKAIEYHEQALAIARETGNSRVVGARLGDLGKAYADSGEMDKAIEYNEQALSIARETGDRIKEDNWLRNLGDVYAMLGQPQKAIDYYAQALAITRETGNRGDEVLCAWSLGEQYAAMGDLPRALELMQIRLDYEAEIGHPEAKKHADYLEELRARAEALDS